MATLCSQGPPVLDPSLLSTAPAIKAPQDQEEAQDLDLQACLGVTGAP